MTLEDFGLSGQMPLQPFCRLRKIGLADDVLAIKDPPYLAAGQRHPHTIGNSSKISQLVQRLDNLLPQTVALRCDSDQGPPWSFPRSRRVLW